MNVLVAKTNLSSLLRRVEAGEEIVLCRRGRPIARLVPEVVVRGRVAGRAECGVAIGEGFDEPFLTERWILLERRRR